MERWSIYVCMYVSMYVRDAHGALDVYVCLCTCVCIYDFQGNLFGSWLHVYARICPCVFVCMQNIYVCVYVCMVKRMWGHLFGSEPILVCVCVYVCVPAYSYMIKYVWGVSFESKPILICMHVRVYVCVYLHVYIWPSMCENLHLGVRMFVCVSMHVSTFA